VCTCNPSTEEADAGALQVRGQAVFYSEFEGSLGHIARPLVKKPNQNTLCEKEGIVPLLHPIYKYHLKPGTDGSHM
jgi:hypothetical protein